MIINFSVQNFHCIKDKVTLSFEADKSTDLEDYYIIEPKKGLRLLKLGLIYGANASGKTTILKALGFLKHIVTNPFSKKTDTFQLKPFLFDPKTPHQNSFFTLEFIENKVKYLYEIELNKQAIVEEKMYFYKPRKALLYSRTTDEKNQFTTINFGSKISIPKENKTVLEGNTLWNNTVLGGYLKTNIELKQFENILHWFKNSLANPIFPKTDLSSYIANQIEANNINKKQVIEILKKADFNITDLVIESKPTILRANKIYFSLTHQGLIPGTTKVETTDETEEITVKQLFFRHSIKDTQKEEHYLLNISEESTGTQRYYGFAGLLAMMIQDKSIFPIDELAASLHPDLLRHFLLTFLVNAKESQLIATTHYRELLKEKDILRADAIWFTEKKADGGTDLFSLADFDTLVIRDTSSVYNAYKIGKLGATPNLGDYYINLEEDGAEK